MLEDIQLCFQGPGECPRLDAIQEDWQYLHRKQAELCIKVDAGLPNPMVGGCSCSHVRCPRADENQGRYHHPSPRGSQGNRNQ